MTAEEVYAILKKQIQSGGGGSDSGSSDDSAPPIVEVYNGQTIQCSMSADRPLKGLNLYATTEQATTTGAQLFDASLFPTTSSGGATVTNNGDGSFTISGEGQLTEDFNISHKVAKADLTLKPGAISISRESVIKGCVPEMYLQALDSDGSILFNITNRDELRVTANITEEMIERIERYSFGFWGQSGRVITPATFSPMVYQDGDGTYEPYTGGKPSPSPEYPQEIQTISDFAVEVKNSMGEVAAPQTLDVTIPEQGFYGIPVSADGNYTDSSGQQWICDEFDFANKKFIKRIGRFSLDGSEDETWGKSTTGKDHQQFRTFFPKAPNNSGWCLCNRFIYEPSAREVGYCFVWNSGFFICVELSINTVALLRDYLNTHPLDVIYPLETPAEYDLTDEQVEQYKKLRSCYGTTYIDNDAVPVCNMQAELVLDTKLYIDSKFATLAGQIIEDSSFIVNGNEEPYPSGGTGSQDKPDDPADDFADDDDMI